MCTTIELNNVQGSAQPRPQGAFPKAREKRPGDELGSAAPNAGDRVGNLEPIGGLFQIADVCGVFL